MYRMDILNSGVKIKTCDADKYVEIFGPSKKSE